MAYQVEIRRAAQKELLSLTREARVYVVQIVDNLARTPRPTGCRKLRESGLWRIRKGRFRVIYSIDDERRLVTVVKVGIRREDTYRRP